MIDINLHSIRIGWEYILDVNRLFISTDQCDISVLNHTRDSWLEFNFFGNDCKFAFKNIKTNSDVKLLSLVKICSKHFKLNYCNLRFKCFEINWIYNFNLHDKSRSWINESCVRDSIISFAYLSLMELVLSIRVMINLIKKFELNWWIRWFEMDFNILDIDSQMSNIWDVEEHSFIESFSNRAKVKMLSLFLHFRAVVCNRLSFWFIRAKQRVFSNDKCRKYKVRWILKDC